MKRTLLAGLVIGAVVALGLTLGCRPAAVETVTVETIAPAEPDAGPVAAVPADDLKALVEANNHFAIELYKKLAETEKGNIFFSPYSIHAALSMTYAGARGETAAQMAKVLGIEKLGDRVHPAHAELARKLKSDGGKDKPEFNVANALWGQKDLGFRPEFLDLTKRHYGAGLRELDFVSDAEGPQRSINEWISNATRGKIPKLFEQSLPSNTRLVLTNASYFNGKWAKPFDKLRTHKKEFHEESGLTSEVQMMNSSTEQFAYGLDGDVQIVRLPYSGATHGLVVFLPKLGELPKLRKALTAERFQKNLGQLAFQEGTISLPKVEIRNHLAIKTILMALGMLSAFDQGADFRGLNNAPLHLNVVQQSSFLSISETETVAVAATGVEGLDGTHRLPFTVMVDRPFLFSIVELDTGFIQYLGEVRIALAR